jgi:hypothetical protein
MTLGYKYVALSVGILLARSALAQPVPATSSSRARALWEIGLTLDGYIVPDQDGYFSPTLAADREWLHLEARYNYEDLRTGSLWAGYNFSVGKKLVSA